MGLFWILTVVVARCALAGLVTRAGVLTPVIAEVIYEGDIALGLAGVGVLSLGLMGLPPGCGAWKSAATN